MKYYGKVTYVVSDYFEVDADSEDKARELIEEEARYSSLNDFREESCTIELSLT